MTSRGTISLKPKWRLRPAAVVLIVLVSIVLPVAAHGVFRWHARRVLQADIASLRAAGERVLPRDFAPPAPSPIDNAAPDLRAAAAIVDDASEEALSISWVPSTLPIDPRALPYLIRARTWFEPALRRIERGRQRPVCQWSHRFESPVIERMLLPELNGLRALATLVWSALMLEHAEGRHDMVVLRFRQSLYLADTCERTPAPAAHLVALAINAGTAERIESLAPSLEIGSGGSGAGGASPPEVRALIAALLDQSALDAGFRTCIESERMVSIDTLDHFVRGANELNAAAQYLYEPVVDVNARRVLHRTTRAVEATRGTHDWPTAAARLDRIEPFTAPSSGCPSIDPLPVIRRATRAHFSRLTDRRLAATALATCLYRAEHDGRWPRALAELVPAYLPAVPSDAMAVGGLPIRYLPSADRPALYSVGRNGADDLGSEVAMPAEYGRIDAWRRMDRVFYLGGQSRAEIYVAAPGGGTYAVEDVGRPPWEEETTTTFESATASQPVTRP